MALIAMAYGIMKCNNNNSTLQQEKHIKVAFTHHSGHLCK